MQAEVRRRAVRAAAMLALVAAIGALSACSGSGPAGHRPAASARASGLAPAWVSAGPDGVRASSVAAENARPGSASWRITGPQPAHGIEGYADAVQTQPGRRVTLYVSTAAARFTVAAYRMGYYQGLGARLVWTSAAVSGGRQPACPVTAGTHMVACRWRPSLSATMTGGWAAGEYLLKLVGAGGQQSYVPLTVTDPGSAATYVIMDGSLTDQVFNAYGGYDLYQGATPCAPGVYPCSSRSRVVSFDRPYAGTGDGGYLALTYPLTRLAEQHGLDVTYWTDITLHEYGDQLSRHRVLLSLGHDEEWSAAMRRATVAATGRGLNVAFFGASPVLRKVRLQPSPLGPDREVVNYRNPQADPLYGHDNAAVSQNSWAQPPANAPAPELVGATYIGYNNGAAAPLIVTDPTSWLYAGTGLTAGATVPGVMRTDFQEYLPGEPGPADVTVQAHSPVRVELHGAQYADTSYYTTPAGAGIWQSGTNQWIPALGTCTTGQPCRSHLLAQMTLNLLHVLGTGPLGARYPSAANWQHLPR